MKPISTQRAVVIFLALAFAYLLSTLVRAVTATLAPTLVHEFALGAGDLGLLAGGYFLGFAATQLPLGTWLDRFGPKRVEFAFLSVAVLGCIVFSVAQNFAALLLGRVLCGVGVSACLMAPLTGYRRWYAPANQMRANSWMLMCGALGMLASTLPVQWLLPLVGWRPLFWILAAGVFAAMLIIAWQLPDWQAQAAKVGDVPPGYGEVWRHPYFRKMVPMGFFGYGGLVAMQTLWAGPWMVKVAGYSAGEAATGLFWINACMLVTYWMWGWANPWLARNGYSADRLIRVGGPLSFILIGLMAACGSAASGYATLLWALFCMSSSLCTLAQPAVGMAFRSEMAGRALSAYNLVVFCGVFAVQWGLGLAIDALRALGWTEVLAYQGALGGFGLCCAWAYVHFLLAKKP